MHLRRMGQRRNRAVALYRQGCSRIGVAHSLRQVMPLGQSGQEIAGKAVTSACCIERLDFVAGDCGALASRGSFRDHHDRTDRPYRRPRLQAKL